MRVKKEEGKGTWTRCEVWGRKNRDHEQRERKENLHYKVNKRKKKTVIEGKIKAEVFTTGKQHAVQPRGCFSECLLL